MWKVAGQAEKWVALVKGHLDLLLGPSDAGIGKAVRGEELGEAGRALAPASEGSGEGNGLGGDRVRPEADGIWEGTNVGS